VARQMQSGGDASSLPRVVLCGLPNAGKSSLLNALAGEDAAIVSDFPGTTRDFVARRVCWGGVELNLIDTAGLDELPPDEIGTQAQLASKAQAENCDLRLWCAESANCPAASDLLGDSPAI